MQHQLDDYEDLVATAILGIDTIWGGDVANPSGTGRFIADCYFSSKVYPRAYTDPLAARLREAGGVSAKAPDRDAVLAYLRAFDLRGRIQQLAAAGRGFGGLRGEFVVGLAGSLEVMLDLAVERIGDGPAVPYERCVDASCAQAPGYCDTAEDRERVRRMLAAAGLPTGNSGADLVRAVDAWRASRAIGREDIATVSSSLIPRLDALTAEAVAAHLPEALRAVPRANITFMPIEDAWFSGSMNYLGRERTADGEPCYEATYEINASLQIARPEFEHLVAHEVVPGHVMTFALIQSLHHRGELGFEATILTMNSRATTLYEGIANNALYMAHGGSGPEALPDDEARLGALLALLQDRAKNNASYLIWGEGQPPEQVAPRLREECLVSEERADKLATAWGAHPLLGRMYLPSYHRGTELVTRLLRDHGPARAIPALYGARGLVDCATVEAAIVGA